jgi:hypothetical protein
VLSSGYLQNTGINIHGEKVNWFKAIESEPFLRGCIKAIFDIHRELCVTVCVVTDH